MAVWDRVFVNDTGTGKNASKRKMKKEKIDGIRSSMQSPSSHLIP
jgi:hypothetical protein